MISLRSCQAADNKPMLVYILSGQSNMVPQGKWNDMPDDLKKTSDSVYEFKSPQWYPYKPSKLFGPEHSFADAMARANPNFRIGIFVFSQGATNLYEDWTPDKKDKTDSLYSRLIRIAQVALKAPNVSLGGMVWLQGEGDTKRKETAEKYGANLKTFIECVRKDLNAPTMPFVVGHIKPNPNDLPVLRKNCPFIDIVQMAQANLKLEHTRLALTENIERDSGDHVHYGTKGMIEVGKIFAEAMQKLLAEKK